MIYTKQYRRYNDGCDGQWHCPFPSEWVEKMKRAVKHCENLSAEYIERTLENDWMYYSLPPGDFLSMPQDSRGVPIGYDNSSMPHISCEIYDYSTIPDIVVTNGRADWPLCVKGSVLMA